MFRALWSPRLVGLHLLAIVAVSAAGWLGLWQYDAWQAARAAEARDLASAEPKALRDVLGPDDPYPGDAIGQPVRLEGNWVSEGSFLVSGRELGGRSGYWVVSPLAVCDNRCGQAPAAPSTPAMLVVRGWTPQPELPAAPAGEVRLTGWLQPPEDTGRPDPDPGDEVLPEVSVADAIQRVDRDLFGGYVIAEELTATGSTSAGSESAGSAAGLDPVTPEALPEPETFTSLRNLLYALEWWVFAAFALFVWWRWCRDVVQGEQEVLPPGSTDGHSEPVVPMRSTSEDRVASRS